MGNGKNLKTRMQALFVTLAIALASVMGIVAMAPKVAVAKPAVVQTASATKKMIGKTKALNIALKNAKLKKSQIKGLEIEIGREKGRKVYEIEWRYGKYEYEYDIDVYTGKIVDKEIERKK